MKKETILITGATGFVGNHLLRRLLADGYSVIGTSRTQLTKNIKKVDIENFPTFEKFVIHNNITQIIHLAGSALVEEGQTNPMGTFKTNILGTLHVLEIARRHHLERVIIASTSHVYGKNKVPYKEIYSPHPTRPYETSKACIDLMAQSYAKTYDLRILIPRFVNIYGPGDKSETRLIPRTIHSILQGKNPKMWGGGSQRDYLYIDDAINAYLALLQAPKSIIKKQYIFNFGTEDVISVENLLKKIIAFSGGKNKINIIPDQRSEEISLQYLSIARAKRVLHWKPNVSFDEGLERTIAWFKTQK